MKKQTRAETGPMEFQGDWPGIFIRGDDCFAFQMALEQALKSIADPLARGTIENLAILLRMSDVRHKAPVVKMKSFEECTQ